MTPTREEFEQQFKVFWEGLNRQGRRDFLAKAKKGILKTKQRFG